MRDNEKLEGAVRFVNTFNRTGAKPIVEVVSCAVCGRAFASQVQDAELARRRGLGRICPQGECQNEARRRRQRGERRAQDDLRRVFFAVLELGGASAGVPVPQVKDRAAWSAADQRAGALDDLREALELTCASVEEWARRIDIGPGPIPVKAILRQAGEAVYPLLFPGAKSDQEHNEARALEKLGPVAWGLKAELERNIERPGDWVPELRQIWPDGAPGVGSEAYRQVSG